MVRRDDYNTVETIISTLREVDKQISFDRLSKQTNIRTNSLKKWLKIMELIQGKTIDIRITENGISTQVKSEKLTNILTQVKKREEDPNIQEFLTEFRGVLKKTKLSLEDEKTKNYPNLKSYTGYLTNRSSEFTELQSELTQVLEQGLSFLTSAKEENKDANSKSELVFMQELKQAVNLGIENLEKVVVTDYKAKKGRVNAMKSELELAFEARKKRRKVKEGN